MAELTVDLVMINDSMANANLYGQAFQLFFDTEDEFRFHGITSDGSGGIEKREFPYSSVVDHAGVRAYKSPVFKGLTLVNEAGDAEKLYVEWAEDAALNPYIRLSAKTVVKDSAGGDIQLELEPDALSILRGGTVTAVFQEDGFIFNETLAADASDAAVLAFNSRVSGNAAVNDGDFVTLSQLSASGGKWTNDGTDRLYPTVDYKQLVIGVGTPTAGKLEVFLDAAATDGDVTVTGADSGFDGNYVKQSVGLYKLDDGHWIASSGWYWNICTNASDIWATTTYYGAGGQATPGAVAPYTPIGGATGTPYIALNSNVAQEAITAHGKVYSTDVIKAERALQVSGFAALGKNSDGFTTLVTAVDGGDATVALLIEHEVDPGDQYTIAKFLPNGDMELPASDVTNTLNEKTVITKERLATSPVVPNNGLKLNNNDGTIIEGTSKSGAVTMGTCTDGSTGFPYVYGVHFTFDGGDYGRTFSIFKRNSGDTEYSLQTYEDDGTAKGWQKISFKDGIFETSKPTADTADNYVWVGGVDSAMEAWTPFTDPNDAVIMQIGNTGQRIAIGADTAQDVYIARTDTADPITEGQWHKISFQNTEGGGSNIASGGTVGTDADNARTLYAWCDVNTPQDGVFYLINSIINGDTGSLENQFAMGGTGGIYKRDSVDNGATWTEWIKLANVSSFGDWKDIDISSGLEYWDIYDGETLSVRTSGNTVQLKGMLRYTQNTTSGPFEYTYTFSDLGFSIDGRMGASFQIMNAVDYGFSDDSVEMVFASSSSITFRGNISATTVNDIAHINICCTLPITG